MKTIKMDIGVEWLSSLENSGEIYVMRCPMLSQELVATEIET